MIKISVIIPTYHDWERLQLCIDALDKQSFPKADFEIIVVNNDPSDSSPADFHLPANCIIIHEAIPGSYAARNAAIRIAKGEILAFTDSDCIPDKHWLKNANLYFVQEGAERIGGNVEIFYQDSSNKTSAELYESVFSFNQKRNVEKHMASITANLIVQRKFFDSVGEFNPNVKSGGDFEWNRRATSKDIAIIYAHNVKVFHPARNTIKELAQKRRRVYGGQKTFTFNSAKLVLKEFLYIPLLIYFNLFFPILRLLVHKGPSFVEKFKILVVILSLYLVTQLEYFRLLLGRPPNR